MNLLNQKFRKLEAELGVAFHERRDVIHLAICALLSREHVLFLGPPGTAKSALVRAIAGAFGATYFERLLTRFSQPDELFGPVSLKALEAGRYERVSTGTLAEAQFALIDEVFKANAAVLNGMLGVMNERTYANGGAPMPVPLLSLFSASNELPEGQDLEAVFDRFLCRVPVDYLQRQASTRALLTAVPSPVKMKLTVAELIQAQQEAAKTKVSDQTIEAVIELRSALLAEGIVASDRRWKACLSLVKATAWMADEPVTTPEDVGVLTDSLWRDPKDRSKVARVIGKHADPAGSQAQEVLDAARETAGKVRALKTGDRKAFLSQAAQALEQFTQQQTRLAALTRSAGRRAKAAIADANVEIAGLHEELAKAVSAGLGLRRAAP